MKIAFNPSTVAALTTPPNNKDITFDLRGHSIFARGVEFKGTDTNTWRDIKINNVSIGSNILDLRNGSNTTLTNTNGVVTINSTWRPVVDNLTSDSTTSSLSAKQGKVLKALIDGKSNSDHNHDGRYLKLTGGTMLGALNFANNTWNLVGDDSYIGDCNISGHFGIKAANTTYPGITFFNNASTFLGNLTAYSGNIKYGAYSLQFLDNGNTSVSASTWTNPFSNYNSNAVADGQAICVWGQSSYLSNLSPDTGNMSLWLKRINDYYATLNMVLDGEYYANGNQRLAHVSEIPNKDSWNYDDRYLRLTGGWMSGDINFGGDNKIYWERNTNSASISFKNDGDGDANSYMSFVTSDNGNEYFRWSHNSGSTNTEWMALRSDGLRVRGTKVSLEGHAHDDRYYTKVESNAKYITDITTSVNKLTFTRNGSNIARDITVNVVYSQGKLTNIPNKDATTKASPGLLIYDSYEQVIGTNFYSSVLSINTGGTIQIAGNWGDDMARNLYWRSQSDKNVADYPWESWRTILDSENYSSTLDSRYYTESEVNSLLDAKLNRQNLSYGNWNPRGYHLAADYHYNGGDLSISENNGKMYVLVDGCFWQNEGQYRVLDTSDIGDIRDSVTLHQYLSATDAAWYPLVWGGNAHKNTSDSTGVVYKSYDKLSWQTSSQTLYATHLRTTYIDLENNRGIFQVTSGDTSPYKGIRLPDLQSNGIGMFSKIGSGDDADEGGIIISADTSVIYNSFDTDWGLTVRDKDRGQTDISGDGTIAFGVRQDYRAYSLGGFEKAGSDNSYVLLGGGNHKLESSLNVAYSKYLTGIAITGGNSNNEGYRLIFERTMGGWTINYGVWAIAFRHSGRGTLNIGFDTTNNDGSTYIYDIRFLGSIASIGHTPFRAFYNSTTKVFRIYWYYVDYTSGDIAVLRGNMEPHNGTWMTSLPNDVGTELAITYNMADQAVNADTVDGVHLNGIFTGFSYAQSRLTATIGTVSKTVNVTGSYPSIGGVTMNTIASYGNCMGMANLASSNSNVNPNNQTSWHHFINMSYNTESTNMWQTQFAIKAGTTEVWVRSRAGGSISDSSAWAAPWVRLARITDNIASATNADMVDGEHASSFVRAGRYESNDLNKLDTYSFIRSVNSNVSSTSPKGNTGWYNVIQLVHRNGAADGPSYIGQIALGMTTNTNDMFFRGKRTDPWKTVIHSGNYTEFINNYYWANVKISTSSSTTTSPTVSNLTATNSIRLGDIHLEYTNEINSYGGLLINYRSSADVDLCQGGGNVCIGATLPTQKLDVRGNIITKGLGIQPYYLSESVLLPTIRLDDGHTYKCLEISATTEISCIIADRAGLMSERGILIKFNKGYDGQIILLKDLQSYGSGNGYFWVMPSGCKIISADNSSILVGQNQISNTYDDGRSRFLVYSSVYSVWIEFLCSNTF